MHHAKLHPALHPRRRSFRAPRPPLAAGGPAARTDVRSVRGRCTGLARCAGARVARRADRGAPADRARALGPDAGRADRARHRARPAADHRRAIGARRSHPDPGRGARRDRSRQPAAGARRPDPAVGRASRRGRRSARGLRAPRGPDAVADARSRDRAKRDGGWGPCRLCRRGGGQSPPWDRARRRRRPVAERGVRRRRASPRDPDPHAAVRARRRRPPRRQLAAGRGQRVVPRGQLRRAARPHRVRPPVRAPVQEPGGAARRPSLRGAAPRGRKT